MRIRFFNGRILTMERKEGRLLPMIENGELWTEDGRVTYVGETLTVPRIPEPAPRVRRGSSQSAASWDREINLQGNLLLPGFKNAHTHSAMTFLRSYADDLPLAEWLERQVFPMEAKLEPEDIYWLSKLAILEYLTSGITANFDMYFHPEMIAKASVECGFRTVLVSSLNDFVSSPEEMEEFYLRFNQYHELIRYNLGFHAEYTTGEARLKAVVALAEKYQAPVFAHLSETKKEVEECIARHGLTPPAYLDRLELFDWGGGGYHCVHMTGDDIRLFAEKKLTAVLNSGSNTKLASGIAPVTELLGAGVPLAIGTDGPASNNCLDMFREMFLVTGLAKLREQDASAVPAEQVLEMAVSGGARAMGLTDCDCLAAGKRADLTVIDLHQPNMQPLNNPVRNLVYSGSKANVVLTMVNGQILYERGQFFVGTDPEEIYSRANAVIGRMRGTA